MSFVESRRADLAARGARKPPPVVFASPRMLPGRGADADRARTAAMIVAVVVTLAVVCFGLGYLFGRLVLGG